MPRVAIKNTYGIEMIGGVEVRRLIVAGQRVPPNVIVPDGVLADVESPASAHAESEPLMAAQPGESMSEFAETPTPAPPETPPEPEPKSTRKRGTTKK